MRLILAVDCCAEAFCVGMHGRKHAVVSLFLVCHFVYGLLVDSRFVFVESAVLQILYIMLIVVFRSSPIHDGNSGYKLLLMNTPPS